MSIKSEASSLARVNTKDLAAKADKGDWKQVFGIRMRSNGFTWMASVAQAETLQHNALESKKVLGEIWKRLDRLEALNKQAYADYEKFSKEASDLGKQIDAKKPEVEKLQKEAEAARAAADADEDNKSKQKAAEDAENRFNKANDDLGKLGERQNKAAERANQAGEDIEACQKATDEIKKAITAVCEQICKKMGMENVFLYENRRDSEKEAKSGKIEYKNDAMTFTEKSSNLIMAWAATFRDGANILSQEKANMGTSKEIVAPISPSSRAAFRAIKQVDDKTKDEKTGQDKPIVRTVATHEAEVIIGMNMGAIALMRQLLQRMMEEITATATKRHA
jgi:archaellum component FlaC